MEGRDVAPETDELEVEARLTVEDLPLVNHPVSLAVMDPRPEMEEEEVEARLMAEGLPPLVPTETPGTASGS
jgi:hypothetical protein